MTFEAERPALLRAEKLTRAFGPRRLFGPLSFEVKDGSVFGIAGANGAGKTTLVKTLLGLQRPSSGSVLVSKDRASGPSLSPRDAQGLLGWCAPDTALYGELTPVENLAFFARLLGRPSSGEATAAALDGVGLDPERMSRMETRLLSTGQRQRVKLAFSVLAAPPLLFLDEPSSNLDEAGRAIVAKVVAAQRRRGACVLASNDARDLGLADEVLSL